MSQTNGYEIAVYTKLQQNGYLYSNRKLRIAITDLGLYEMSFIEPH